MKKQTLAAFIIAAIALSMYSCDRFSKKEKAAQPPLIGTWKVIGISDSSKHQKNGTPSAFFASGDSSTAVATFGTDSSLALSYANNQMPETTKYYMDTAMQRLYVKKDSSYKAFAIETLNDSLLRLSIDSVFVELKKQP